MKVRFTEKEREHMSEAKLVMVSISSIDANPMRKLKRYPYNKLRLANLEDSIGDVGFFEGVHARKVGNRYQLAFGHHRIEACRKQGLKKVPLLVGSYSDEEMLKMLSRENDDVGEGRMEVFQEVWEAAMLFYKAELAKAPETKQTAFLAKRLGGGWEQSAGKSEPRDSLFKPSQRAKACAKVIGLGLDPKQFTGVSARTANEVVTKAQSLEKKVDGAEDRGDLSEKKAEGLRGKIWADVEEIVQIDADPLHNPGRKLGYRAAKAELTERWKDKIPEAKPRPRPAVFGPTCRKLAKQALDLHEGLKDLLSKGRFITEESHLADVANVAKAVERVAELLPDLIELSLTDVEVIEEHKTDAKVIQIGSR
jgi:hypothetical protein